MQKISARHAVAVLSEVPGTLRKLAARNEKLEAENTWLVEELAKYQLNDRVEKLASAIHDKGVHQGRTFEETKEELLKEATQLDVVDQAVQRIGRQQSFGILGDKVAGTSGNAENDFVNSLMGGF